MNKSKQLTDGALLSSIFIVLLLITVFVPVLSFFTMFLLAVPFVIFAAKYDWKPSLIMLFVVIVLSILFATILSLPLPILSGLGGIMIGSGIHRKKSPYETWARGTIGFATGILIIFVFAYVVLQINIIEEFNLIVNESLVMSKEMMMTFGMGEVSEEQFNLIEQQMNIYKQLIPVFIVFSSILLALINQWVSYKILNRIERKQLRFPKFRNLRFPTSIIWIHLFAIIGTLFQTETSGTFFIALQNIIMLTGLLMILQGFSFIFFYSHHKKLSKAIPIIAIVLAVLFAPILLPLVRILGIIDLGFGLRERMVK
ncbi:YybS family protein [Paucisalibacillus sp. EB02]|uniref:YybS family protein n=1 Tax=Paucisalibacillus sp. EB02 TaxID=1347087 RepID=UPI0004B44E42|nr:YybS family protein [Paucisalibacillus sp. EB02]